MKPKKLIMSAFGSFAGQEEIDFVEIEKEPVFLICGPTGAGKTTIFDAITYALFGDASGEGRKPESMRSDFAGPDTITSVELTFEVRGKTYYILRQPRQTRLKKSGDGLTEIAPKVELKYQDEAGEFLVFTKQAEVNEKIKEIIGLGLEQFKQIIMLPQGEFRKLLTADSKQREEILREIFDANQYLKLQLELKEEADQIEKQIKEQKTMQKHWIMQLQTDEKDVADKQESPAAINTNEPNKSGLAALLLQDEIDRVELFAAVESQNRQDRSLAEQKKESAAQQSIARDHLKEKLFRWEKENEKFLERKEIEDKKSLLESQKPEMDAKQEKLDTIRKAVQLKPYAEYLEKMHKQLLAIQEEVKGIDQKGRDIESRHQNILPLYQKVKSPEWQSEQESLEKEAVELGIQIPMMLDLLQLKEVYSALAKECKRKEVYLTSCTEEKVAVQEESKKLRSFLTENEGVEARVVALEQKKADWDTAAILLQKQKQVDVKVSTVLQEFERVTLRQRQIEDVYLEYQKKLRQDHVHALRKDLADGVLCPVCNNIYHLQGREESLPDNPEWQGIEEKRERINTEREAVLSQKIEWEEKQKLLMEQWMEWKQTSGIEEEDFDGAALAKRQFEIGEELTREKETFAKVRTAKEKLLEREEKLEKLEIQFQKAQADLLNQKIEVERTAGEGKNLKKQILPIYHEKVSQEGIAELQKKLSDIQSQKQGLVQHMQEVEAKYQDVLRMQAENRVLMERTEKQVSELLEQEKMESQKFIERLQENAFSNRAAWQEYALMEPYTDSIEAEIKEYHAAWLRTVEVYQRLKTEVSITQPYDLSELQETIRIQQLEIERELQESAYYLGRAKENERIYNALKEVEKEREKLSGDYALVSKIAKVANGDNAKKLTFERYVLAAFLEDVLQVANYRLTKMTGRYTLKRKEEVTHRGRQSGLELEVFDAFTGKTRGIGTLSGGESFKTALAMALGLSEVVSSYSGGIEMDMLFIDEGFGTLDPESLDSAIDCILDLQAKGKMIGIISHVAELKERIPAKLEVVQTVKGSYTKYHVGEPGEMEA